MGRSDLHLAVQGQMQNGHLMAATLASLFFAGTLIDQDQIRANTVPKKLKDGENDSLTTPLSVTGTVEELNAELSRTIVCFVGAHLQMKNTLETATAEMETASKAARREARAKSKAASKPVVPKTQSTQPDAAAKAPEPVPLNSASLFDLTAPEVNIHRCAGRIG